jgi:hypothetical protein
MANYKARYHEYSKNTERKVITLEPVAEFAAAGLTLVSFYHILEDQ